MLGSFLRRHTDSRSLDFQKVFTVTITLVYSNVFNLTNCYGTTNYRTFTTTYMSRSKGNTNNFHNILIICVISASCCGTIHNDNNTCI